MGITCKCYVDSETYFHFDDMKLALPINPASETNAWVFGSISEVDGKFQFIDQVSYKLCQLFSQPFPSILHLQLEISCPGQLTRYMLKLHLSINVWMIFRSRGRGWKGRGSPRPGITLGVRETDWVQQQRSSVDPLHRFWLDRGNRDWE